MCNFDPNKCSLTCNKYPMCSFYSIQNQLSDIQSQLNFIYQTLNKTLKDSEERSLKVNLLESSIFKVYKELYDSEPNNNK